MSLKIYGVPKSRAYRPLWLAHELGLDYELIGVEPRGARSDAFAKVNPNGSVPAIDDDGVHLWESMAINLYLAKKHGGPLAPKDIIEDGQMTMWSFWVATNVEPHAFTALMHRAFLPEDKRVPEKAEAAIAACARPTAVLEAHLAANGGFLVGGRFTVADLNVAAVYSWLRAAPEVTAAMPHVTAWLDASLSRPGSRAAIKARVSA